MGDGVVHELQAAGRHEARDDSDLLPSGNEEDGPEKVDPLGGRDGGRQGFPGGHALRRQGEAVVS